MLIKLICATSKVALNSFGEALTKRGERGETIFSVAFGFDAFLALSAFNRPFGQTSEVGSEL